MTLPHEIDSLQTFFDLLECNTSYFKLKEFGVLWYALAKENTVSLQGRCTKTKANKEIQSIRSKHLAAKSELLHQPVDAILLTKAKMRGMEDGEFQNTYFFEIQKKLRAEGKKFLILEQASNSEHCDLKFIGCEDEAVTLPYEELIEAYISSNSEHYEEVLKSPVEEYNKIMQENSGIDFPDSLFPIATNFLDILQSVLIETTKHVLLLNELINSTKCKVVFGGMGMHYYPGVRGDVKVVHVEHGVHSAFLCTPEPHFPVQKFWNENLPMRNLYSLCTSQYDELFENEPYVPEENRFNAGIPAFRSHVFSESRVSELRAKFDNKKIVLVLTTGRVSPQNLSNIILAIKDEHPDVQILLRPHPGYDCDKDYSEVRDLYVDVSKAKLYDLMQVADVVVSVPSSVVVEAMNFTNNIICITDNRFAGLNRLLIQKHFWDKVKVVDSFALEEFLFVFKSMLQKTDRVDRWKEQVNRLPELDRLFRELF